jgi:hypothetical protein
MLGVVSAPVLWGPIGTLICLGPHSKSTRATGSLSVACDLLKFGSHNCQAATEGAGACRYARKTLSVDLGALGLVVLCRDPTTG